MTLAWLGFITLVVGGLIASFFVNRIQYHESCCLHYILDSPNQNRYIWYCALLSRMTLLGTTSRVTQFGSPSLWRISYISVKITYHLLLMRFWSQTFDLLWCAMPISTIDPPPNKYAYYLYSGRAALYLRYMCQVWLLLTHLRLFTQRKIRFRHWKLPRISEVQRPPLSHARRVLPLRDTLSHGILHWWKW